MSTNTRHLFVLYDIFQAPKRSIIHCFLFCLLFCLVFWCGFFFFFFFLLLFFFFVFLLLLFCFCFVLFFFFLGGGVPLMSTLKLRRNENIKQWLRLADWYHCSVTLCTHRICTGWLIPLNNYTMRPHHLFSVGSQQTTCNKCPVVARETYRWTRKIFRIFVGVYSKKWEILARTSCQPLLIARGQRIMVFTNASRNLIWDELRTKRPRNGSPKWSGDHITVVQKSPFHIDRSFRNCTVTCSHVW